MSATADTPSRAAIVGAGPAGFYAAAELLRAGWEVDMIDALPTPFGLVRAGVAPDHPKIKSVTRVYEKTALRPGFRFFGGITLGTDIARDDLRRRYHAVVYAFGTAAASRLGIPGEDRPGSHAATELVAWYNGHPGFTEHEFELAAERVVVIGNGNVAVDVARMLVLAPEELAVTDTADHAIEVLSAVGPRHVTLLGRRGPVQAAFTTPELRELGELTRADVLVRADELELDPPSAAALEDDTAAQRNLEVLREFAARERTGRDRLVELRFRCAPVEILGEGDDGPVTAVRVARTRLEAGEGGRLRAVPTGEEEVIPCGLVLRAVGYRGVAVPGLPFDERRGVIRNAAGRVLEDDDAIAAGEYATGWIKRGPSGVIGTNKKCAAETVALLLEDAAAGRLPDPLEPGREQAEAFLRGAARHVVEWAGWQRIDERETQAGEPRGRPRVKLVRLEDLHDAAGGGPRERT